MTRTVLIVEDMDVCRDALELAFMQVPNLVVRFVATAEQALEWLASNQASVLVTDVHLPSMDGFELVEAIRSKSRLSLPIVVISGDSDPRTPARLARLGADAYFSKPYSPTEVRQKLEQLIDGL